jgi:hypothetical protein
MIRLTRFLLLVLCWSSAIAPVRLQGTLVPAAPAVEQEPRCSIGFRVVESESDIVLLGRVIRPISQSFEIQNGDQISQGLRGVLSLPIPDQEDTKECTPPDTGESLAELVKASGQRGYSAVGSLIFYPSNLTVSLNAFVSLSTEDRFWWSL